MVSFTRLSVEQDSGATVVRFEWRGELTGHNAVLWSLFATDQAGNTRQIGYKTVDDTPAAQFVFDHTVARQTNYPIDAELTETSLTARFAAPALLGVDPAGAGHLRAALCIDGTDIDQRVLTRSDVTLR